MQCGCNIVIYDQYSQHLVFFCNLTNFFFASRYLTPSKVIQIHKSDVLILLKDVFYFPIKSKMPSYDMQDRFRFFNSFGVGLGTCLIAK